MHAVQWFRDGDHPAVTPIKHKDGDAGCIYTFTGMDVVYPGDWIISEWLVTGTVGNHIVCPKDSFDKIYEVIEGM